SRLPTPWLQATPFSRSQTASKRPPASELPQSSSPAAPFMTLTASRPAIAWAWPWFSPACATFATEAAPRTGRGGAGRGDTGRLEVVSKSRRQALRSCAVGLFLVSKPHARRSGKAGSPFLRPLLALSSVGRESSSVLRTGIEPRCGSRPPSTPARERAGGPG